MKIRDNIQLKGPYFNYVSTKGYLVGQQNANYRAIKVAESYNKIANRVT